MILITSACLVLSATACTKKSDPDINSISDGIGQLTEEDYVYRQHTGVWYGFGTDGNDAQFEISINSNDEFSATMEIKGWGANAGLEKEEVPFVFTTADKAYETTDENHQRVIEFKINEYGKETMEIKYFDKTSGNQIAESIQAGRYTDRSTAFYLSSETNKQDSTKGNNKETIDLEQFGVTDTWMYRVVEYTKSGEDIYDDNIEIHISFDGEKQNRETGELEKTYFMTVHRYDDQDSKRTGFIRAYPSDRNGYDAKLLMVRHDESKEVLYFRVVVPNCVYEFIFENGDEFGIYETWDYAHRNYNTEGGGYRRDDYEYKEYYGKPSTWTPYDE